MEMQHKTMMMRAALTLLLAVMTVAGARADDSGSCGVGVYYHYYSDTHKLEIYREGHAFGAIDNDPWKSYRAEIKEVVIGDGVTGIVMEGAFRDCSALTSISIPNSVTKIGPYAFYGCTALTSVSIPNPVTRIGMGAFEDCSALTSISLPSSMTSIFDRTFSGCSSLRSISIPNSVTSIGAYAFSGCTALTSISIPNSVTSIGAYAFSGCTALTSIGIPNSVTSIGENAFSGCSALTSVYCNRNTPPTLETSGSGLLPFAGNANGRKFYVPENCVDAYKAAWSEYSEDVVVGTLYPIYLNVTPEVGGTAALSSHSAAPGEVVTLSATPNVGYDVWWEGTGGAVFYDRLAAQTTFRMPASEVTITAKFIESESSNTDKHKLRLIDNTGEMDEGATTITTHTCTLPSRSRADYVFLGWCEAADGTAVIHPAGETITLWGDWTLYGIWRKNPLVLADHINNSALLENLQNAGEVNVLLARVFYKNGYWNTLCLPFDTALEGTPLAGGELMELDKNKTRYDNGTLNLYFTPAPSIEAGKPYLIRWVTPEKPPTNTIIADPVFQNVTITRYSATYIASDDGSVSFCGNLVPKGLEADDRSVLYLGDGNTLYYPNAQMNVKSFRAYFQLNDGLTASPAPSQGGGSVRIVLGFGEGEATGIDDVQRSTVNGQSASAWHTLDGRQLLHQPTAKGLYLHGGRAVVIK